MYFSSSSEDPSALQTMSSIRKRDFWSFYRKICTIILYNKFEKDHRVSCLLTNNNNNLGMLKPSVRSISCSLLADLLRSNPSLDLIATTRNIAKTWDARVVEAGRAKLKSREVKWFVRSSRRLESSWDTRGKSQCFQSFGLCRTRKWLFLTISIGIPLRVVDGRMSREWSKSGEKCILIPWEPGNWLYHALERYWETLCKILGFVVARKAWVLMADDLKGTKKIVMICESS